MSRTEALTRGSNHLPPTYDNQQRVAVSKSLENMTQIVKTSLILSIFVGEGRPEPRAHEEYED
jgi:hypothetical protein